ncbi:MAG: class I SAM-dependent methyltransferase [Thermoanaerobaculales bacterium]
MSAAPPPYNPEAWGALVDPLSGDLAGAAFRRALELVEREVLSSAKMGSRWLDVGCGVGNLAARLAAGGLECIGVDLQLSMLLAARSRCARIPRVRLIVGDAVLLPFAGGSREGVSAVSVLGGLAQPEFFFRDAARVLTPGGAFWISATNALSWSVRASGLLELLPRAPALESGVGGPRRFRPWRASDLAQALARSGFLVERFITFAHLPPRQFRTAASIVRATSRERVYTHPPLALSARNFLVLARRHVSRSQD